VTATVPFVRVDGDPFGLGYGHGRARAAALCRHAATEA